MRIRKVDIAASGSVSDLVSISLNSFSKEVGNAGYKYCLEALSIGDKFSCWRENCGPIISTTSLARSLLGPISASPIVICILRTETCRSSNVFSTRFSCSEDVSAPFSNVVKRYDKMLSKKGLKDPSVKVRLE